MTAVMNRGMSGVRDVEALAALLADEAYHVLVDDKQPLPSEMRLDFWDGTSEPGDEGRTDWPGDERADVHLLLLDPLVMAARRGDAGSVAAALRTGGAAGGDVGGGPAAAVRARVLAVAALHGRQAVVDVLLAAGVPAAVLVEDALLRAAAKGDAAALAQALAEGADPHAREGRAVAVAACRGHMDALWALLTAGNANPHAPTALTRAVERGHSAAVNLLLARAASVQLRSGRPWPQHELDSALDAAVRRGDLSMARALLLLGAAGPRPGWLGAKEFMEFAAYWGRGELMEVALASVPGGPAALWAHFEVEYIDRGYFASAVAHAARAERTLAVRSAVSAVCGHAGPLAGWRRGAGGCRRRGAARHAAAAAGCGFSAWRM